LSPAEQQQHGTNYDAWFFNEACDASFQEACVIICLILLSTRRLSRPQRRADQQKYETNYDACFVQRRADQQKYETNYGACFFNEACVIICLIPLLSRLTKVYGFLLLVCSSLCGRKYETNYDACFVQRRADQQQYATNYDACFLNEACSTKV